MNDGMADSGSLENFYEESLYETEEKASLLVDEKEGGVGVMVETRKQKSQRVCVTLCILFTELCERLTYYSIVSNLVLFLTNHLDYISTDAVTLSLAFQGTCFFLPIIGGWIADSFAGRFNTIFGSGLIYIVGTFVLPCVAFDYTRWGWSNMNETGQRVLFIMGLFAVAIGTGGIKANVSPFGADQQENAGPNAVQVFFNWFYWFINVGAIIAYAAIAYVQQEIGFDIGYLIPCLSMILAVIIFTSARQKYIQKPPGGSVITTTLKVIGNGISVKRTSIYSYSTFLDYAKKSNGGEHEDEEVENIKQLGAVIPVFACIVFYQTIYAQMGSTFFLQAERMNLNLGSFTLPAASLNLFDSLIILIVVPLMDRVVYPLLDKCWKRPSKLCRIGFGFILAATAMLAAAVLEIYRKKELAETGGMQQDVGGKMFNASNINVLYQAPQFILVGTSEAFSMVTGLEFAYSESPVSLQGLVMGMYLITSGLGNYLGSLLIVIVNAATYSDPWYPDEINVGHIDYYFFLLAGIMMADFFIYLIVAVRYKPKVDPEREIIVGYRAQDAKNYTRLTEEEADFMVTGKSSDSYDP